MDVSQPFQALLPGVDSPVLSVLAGSTRPRTGREIARAAGRSHPAVQQVLDRLVEQGLVDQQRAGRSFVYTLNRDHLATPGVEALAGMRPELFRRLRGRIEAWEIQPQHASVFGSTARGDGTAESDIDLFVVRPSDTDPDDPGWREQIDDLAEAVHSWTGNHAGISETSEGEISRLRRERPSVIDSLKDDAVELAGNSARRLVSRS